MRKIYYLTVVFFSIGIFCINDVYAQEQNENDLSDDENDIYELSTIRSEEVEGEPGLFSLKILFGPELQAVMVAWEDLLKSNYGGLAFTIEDMRKYEYFVYSDQAYNKGIYTVEIRTRRVGSNTKSIIREDGTFIYDIDAKDFSILKVLIS